MADPTNDEKRKAAEAAEAAYVAQEDYQTFSSKGEAQPEYLKAMDFMDSLAPGLRFFNVCRAKTGWNHRMGIAGTCGYASPQKM
eukprot:9873511-Lingulodinium_polyedra.AAC.1